MTMATAEQPATEPRKPWQGAKKEPEADPTSEEPTQVRKMDQKPEADPKSDQPTKAATEGMRGVFHGSEGHGPSQPVVGPRTTEQRLREFLKVSMEVSYDRMVNDLLDHCQEMESQLDGVRLGK